MMEEEDRVLAPRRTRARTEAVECVVAVSFASILAAFLIAFALNMRRAQAELRQTQEARRAQLEAENSALSERARVTAFQERFIGMLGHDLRNPLGALAMGIDLLQRETPAQKRILDRMASSSKRMTRMIDQLLDLTRSRLGGGIELTPAPMDLGKLTSDIVDELHAQMAEPLVRVKSSGDLKGQWDADRLAQVLSNLVGNALHHGAPEKEIEIDLDGTGDDVTFSIQNEGAPISPALQSVLFDPFRRGEQGNSSKTAGVGLGLFISKEIVTRHGGSIEVVSADMRTMFRFTLPRSAA